MLNWFIRRVHSFRCAFGGLGYLFVSQPHARIHLLAVVLVCLAAWLTGVSSVEWSVLILVMALVVTLEAFNTALETLADALHPGHHPLVGRAKDVAAGAVLISAISSVIIAGLIFAPYWFPLQ